MAYAYIQVPGNGANRLLSVPFPFILRAHVKVYLGYDVATGAGTELVEGPDFIWLSDTQIQTTVATALGATATVIRKTPNGTQLVVWSPGSPPTQADLNTADLQSLYVIQEQADLTAAAMITATAAAETANAAVIAVNTAVAAVTAVLPYEPIAAVASIPASPTAGQRIEINNTTGLESFTPLSGRPSGFIGGAGVKARLIYGTPVNATWNWVDYSPVDPDSRYAAITFTQPGNGAVARSVISKLRDDINVLDYGAVSGAVIDSTAAFLAAASAAGTHGRIIVPPGSFRINSNVSVADRQWDVYGFLTGAGKITGDRSQVNIFFPSQYSMPSVYGSFKAAAQILCTETSQHIGDARSNFAVKRDVAGSGAFGPAHSDNGIISEIVKTDWLTSSRIGEVNAIWATIRQGRFSDSGGIIIDSQKVTGGDGGSVAIEASAAWVDSSGVRQTGIQSVLGFLEGAGGWSSNSGYGFYTEAKAGTPYSAFSALGYNDGGTNSPGSWQNLLTLHSDRVANSGSLIFNIDGLGRTYAPSGTATSPSYSFQNDPDTGMYRLGANAFGFATNGLVRWYVSQTGDFIPSLNESYTLGSGNNRIQAVFANAVSLGQAGSLVQAGNGAPGYPAPPGSIYLRVDGGPGTTLYVREGSAWASK